MNRAILYSQVDLFTVQGQLHRPVSKKGQKHRSLLPVTTGLVLACLMQTGLALAAPAITLGVLPEESINLSPQEIARYGQRLERMLRQDPRVTLADGAALSHHLAGRGDKCATEIPCLQQVGQQARADKLLALRVGSLGETVILRLTVFDVVRGVRQGTWQEVLRQTDDRTLDDALERMVRGFLPPPAAAPTRPSWYSRWWVWTIAGAVVAGSVTAAALATRSSGPETVLVPPAQP
jgi:hypothetical protein